MLRMMRDHATSWIIKFLLGAIVIVFVFWGVGSWRSQRMNVLAQVNGEKITVEEFRQAYNNMIERLRSNFGDRWNQDLVEQLQVRQQTLDNLINQKLMLQEAERLEIRVPDAELASSIRRIPAFQREGAFDSRIYQRVLTSNRLAPEEFEVLQRESMMIEKLRVLIESNNMVSDAEALEWYNWKNAEVNIEYVVFKAEDMDDVVIQDAEVEAYFQEHSDAYKTEPMVNAQYLVFRSADYLPETAVSDAEIKAYYQDHADEFKKEKTVEARHILFKVDQNAPEEAVSAARQKALEVLAKARAGKDFAELAKTFSEGPSRDRGGHLGAFTRNQMVKPFSDQAFSMAAGDISEPVRTRFGWHIIKVEKVNPARQETQDEAAPEIRRKLALEKAKTQAQEDAEIAYDATFDHEDLKQTAEALQLDLQTTDFFSSGGPKGIAERRKFAEAAFALEVGDISEIQALGDAYYLLQPIAKRPARVPLLADVKDQVEKDLREHQKNEHARASAERFLEALQKGDAAAATEKVEFKETGFFKRNQSIPQVGYEQAVNTAAFELTAQKPLAGEVLEGRNGWYVIRLLERKAPSVEDFAGEKEDIRQSLGRQKAFKAFESWIARLRDQSEVVIEEQFYN